MIQKPVNIILLPAIGKPNTMIVIQKCIKELSDVKIGTLQLTHKILHSEEYFEEQHLYFLSDEEPKLHDWIIEDHLKPLQIIGFTNNGDIECSNGLPYIKTKCKKIIATTDKALSIESKMPLSEGRTWIKLPQPSQSFIETYIKEYNKGNIITEVMVEYEEIEECLYDFPKQCENSECRVLDKCRKESSLKTILSNLKINPKDNTISTINSEKTYTKEDMINAFMSGISHDRESDIEWKKTQCNNWIKTNI